MFPELKVTTALNSSAANAFFSDKIYAQNSILDTTFIVTLRALLYPRLPEGEKIVYKATNESISLHTAETNPEGTARFLFQPAENEGFVKLINLVGQSDEVNKKTIEAMEKYAAPGWKPFKEIGNLFRKKFECACFINTDTKSVIIVASNLNIRKYHYLQVAILPMFPWYYTKGGVSEIELKLIHTLENTSVDDYVSCINEIAKQYDLERAWLTSRLSGFESAADRGELERLKSMIERCRSKIENLNSSLSDVYEEMNDYCIRSIGVEERIEENKGKSGILDFFLANKSVVFVEAQDRDLTFASKGYLSYFDEALAKRVIENNRSCIYEYCRNINRENMKKLLWAIFIDQKIKIKITAGYRIRVNGNVRGLSDFSYPAQCVDYMPNPHIERFSCIGGYEMYINQYIENGDYISAIEQCVASSMSLNFGDGTVMSEFSKYVDRKAGKYYELPDGTCVSSVDAVEWLLKEEKGNQDEEEKEEGEENG